MVRFDGIYPLEVGGEYKPRKTQYMRFMYLVHATATVKVVAPHAAYISAAGSVCVSVPSSCEEEWALE